MSSRNILINSFYKYKRKVIISSYHDLRKKHLPLRLLFFGSDSFSLPSLQLLHNNAKSSSENKVGVVTSFTSPSNCIRQYAEQNCLHLYKWPIQADICNGYDMGVVVSFGHLIPSAIIKALPLGMINVHASLLPRWRGAAPIIYAIMNGDIFTGVSIMRIEPKRFDIGDIFAQKMVYIKPDILMPELHRELAFEGGNLLKQVLDNYPESFANPQKQDITQVTYAPRITNEITRVDWNEMTAETIYNRFRALFGFKNLSTYYLGRNLQLLDVRLPKKKIRISNYFPKYCQPGSIIFDHLSKALMVKCAENSIVELYRLRLAGKPSMTATEFRNGFLKNVKNYEQIFETKGVT